MCNILVLFIILQLSLCCHENKKLSPYYQRYYSSDDRRYSQSTITCENLTSLRDINYNYKEHRYQQFLLVLNSTILQIEPLELSKFNTITKLYLNNSHVENIISGAFTGLTKLEELYLDQNNLTWVSNGVYNSLNQLKILDLSNNKISRIDNHSFMGMAKLTFLFLQNNNVSKMINGTLTYMTNLKILDLSKNPLGKFDFDLFGVTKLVDLSNCQISEIKTIASVNITNVDLDYNQMKRLNVVFEVVTNFSSRFNNLVTLQTLTKQVAKNSTFDFGYNQISTIENRFFQNLTLLEHLNLDHNNITSINPKLFQNLTSLQTLDLSHNKIANFLFGTFDTLKNLIMLDISNNRLTNLPLKTFHSLSNLINLYFDNNQIFAFEPYGIKPYYLPKLTLITIDGNFWKCDNLVKIQKVLEQQKIFIKKGSSYDVENVHGISCSNSIHLETTPLPLSTKNWKVNITEAKLDNYHKYVYVVFNSVICVLLVFIIYLLTTILKKIRLIFRTAASSQIELC